MVVEVSEAASGVWFVEGVRTNWVLVRAGDGLTLVDAGWPTDYPLVVASLERIKATPAQVEAVVLTHAHADHMGVAERFRAEHQAPVHAYNDEVGHAAGEYVERFRIIDLLIRLWRPSVMAFALHCFRVSAPHPSPVFQVAGFAEGPMDVPGGLIAVPTPGHTSGHCSFYLPDHGVVLAGDALVNQNLLTNRPGPRLMPRLFNHDSQKALGSLDRLATLEADLTLPGHGKAIAMPIEEAVKRATEHLASAGWWDR